MIYITFEHIAGRLEFENSFHRRLFCCGEQDQKRNVNGAMPAVFQDGWRCNTSGTSISHFSVNSKNEGEKDCRSAGAPRGCGEVVTSVAFASWVV